MITLDEIKKGQKAEILDFQDKKTKCHFARFGIEKGHIITCIAKFGALVIQLNNQEIAIGTNICQKIYVKVL